jgi:hypothetical protein
MFYDQINWPFHILFTSFFAISAVLFWWLDRKRRGDFDYAARALHLQHREPSDLTQETLTKQFRFFDKKPGVVHEYVAGSYRQHAVEAFNFTHRKIRTPEMSQIFACVHIELTTALPDLRIAPNDSEKPWQGDDLVFTQADDFHERYKLRSRSPREARAMMNEPVLAFFRRWDNIEVEVAANHLLITVRQTLQPTGLQLHLERAYHLAQLLLQNQAGAITPVQS